MAGIVAVLSAGTGARASRDELDRLIRVYGDLRGEGSTDVEWVGDRGGCAVIAGEVGGGIKREGASWCATVGKIYSAGAGVRSGLVQADGQFAGVRFDVDSKELQVFNDSFGLQSIYVSERGGCTYVSTSATALARHLGSPPDPLGAALFLRTGTQFGPVTHWRGVRRLSPATTMTLGESAPTESTYWRPMVDQRVRRMSFTATVDHCAREVLRTVEARLGSEPCIQADLTGGFDSRLVTAALAQLGVRFTAQTSGETETVDVRLAREVARAGGFEWHQEALPAGWTPSVKDLEAASGWGDGMLEVLQLTEVLWRQRKRSESCELVVTGGGGEHFGPYPWMQEFLKAGRSREINYRNLMSMRVLTPIDLSVLREDPSAKVEGYSREVLGRHVEHLSLELNTTQLDALYALKSVGHFGAYRSASEAYVRSESPCYYKDVFTAGFSAQHRFRNGHRLHRAIIERINPAVGAVETERGGPAQRMRVRNAHRFAPYYWRLAETAVRKVRRRPPPRVTIGTNHAGYRRAIVALAAEGLLRPDEMRSAELYRTSALTALVAQSERPDFQGWATLGRIATLELSLRQVEGASLSTLCA